jgi:hypothetical protein
VSDAASDFAAWRATYGGVASEDEDLFDLAAYITWVCVAQPRINGITSVLGGYAIYDRRYGIERFNTAEQTVCALAFLDDSARHKTISSVLRLLDPDGMTPSWANDQDREYGQAAPPSIALAAMKLELGEETLDSLARMATWWFKWRDTDSDGLPEYAYPGEPGYDFGFRPENGCSIASPDLTSYLIVLCGVLARSIRPDAAKWAELERALTDKLIRLLWDGDKFTPRESGTYKRISLPDDFICYIPVILGKRLPEDVTKKLVKSIFENKPWRRKNGIPLAALLIFGLRELGEYELAREISDWLTTLVRENGFVNNENALSYGSWCASAFLYATRE